MYAELNLGESTNVYDPEKLLSQIIDKIREIQENTRLTKMPKADDAKVEGVDEL
jgi:chemotaxis signal transduction protein